MRENITAANNNKFVLSEIALAGKLNFTDSSKLIDQQLEIINEEKVGNKDRLLKINNLEELNAGQVEKIVDGAVSYTKISETAKIQVLSDLHGCIKDLENPIREFVQQKELGDDRYFSFLGDIGTGQFHKVDILEDFAHIKKAYPKEVNINTGNGDRRSISLFNGLQIEIVQKFCPELYEILDNKTKELLTKYYKEKKLADTEIEEKLKTQGMDYYTFFAAQFLRAARESGAEPLKIKDIDVLYQVMRGASGIDIKSGKTKVSDDGKRYGEKKTETPNVFTFGVLKNLFEALKPEHRAKSDDLIKDEQLKEKTLQVFNYWKKQNEIANQEPVITIYESNNTVVVCSHSGVVKEISGLGDLVDNEEFKTKATWNQFMKDEVTKLGKFDIYDQEDLGKFLGKIVPKNKNVIYTTGHNHGNKIDKIKILDQEGKDLGNKAIRVEVCSGEIKNKEPKYVIIDLAKLKEEVELEEAIEFKDTK